METKERKLSLNSRQPRGTTWKLDRKEDSKEIPSGIQRAKDPKPWKSIGKGIRTKLEKENGHDRGTKMIRTKLQKRYSTGLMGHIIGCKVEIEKIS